MDDKEELELSKEYKKAYNHADLVVTQFPKMLENMKIPEGETSEYIRGFQDRVTRFEIERDAMKQMSYKQLRDKYGKDLDNYTKDKSKGGRTK